MLPSSCRFGSTYEGLKLLVPLSRPNDPRRFGSTYEGLKQQLAEHTRELGDVLAVPMRA